jgi:hypothetical protein
MTLFCFKNDNKDVAKKIYLCYVLRVADTIGGM